MPSLTARFSDDEHYDSDDTSVPSAPDNYFHQATSTEMEEAEDEETLPAEQVPINEIHIPILRGPIWNSGATVPSRPLAAHDQYPNSGQAPSAPVADRSQAEAITSW